MASVYILPMYLVIKTLLTPRCTLTQNKPKPLPPFTNAPQIQWDFISAILYLFTLFGYKFTILLLYLRLFGVNDRFRYATWTVMLFVFGYLFSNLITQLFGCTPFRKSWEKERIPYGHCIVLPHAGLAYGSMNLISDFLIFVLPMPMVWRLRLSGKGKLGVMLCFMGGGM